ncbi:LOW QUALITY PROTEIN: hypothetical protein PNEG_04296 [Pneumocystis murina B123]|uniref:Uncharacterized protein n=1 Tax=Pneumocystis murina (strain B123) TaxID=1069680 RepID=A0A0W4ZX03_PNEMU|nr:LOW QUALITY PROTEIN: hypothetical protein PNEG_04296 [Pneumocystis murina B123]KTW32892.1 LOW QUALITY PROTEIN: hypothetical protein PNEG_04296 [Pneumocystis murina B123]
MYYKCLKNIKTKELNKFIFNFYTLDIEIKNPKRQICRLNRLFERMFLSRFRSFLKCFILIKCRLKYKLSTSLKEFVI